MEEKFVKVLPMKVNHVQMVNVLLMVTGKTGHHGHLAELIVKCQDLEIAITPHHQMGESLVQVLKQSLNPARESNVLKMVFGDFGPHGQIVAVIAKNQGPENVIVLLQQMEETLVLVTVKSLRHVQMVNV